MTEYAENYIADERLYFLLITQYIHIQLYKYKEHANAHVIYDCLIFIVSYADI